MDHYHPTCTRHKRTEVQCRHLRMRAFSTPSDHARATTVTTPDPHRQLCAVTYKESPYAVIRDMPYSYLPRRVHI